MKEFEDFLELAQIRQSCRSFLEQTVEHEKLVKCVEAARLAHSACNAQPWSFVVVENTEIVTQVARCGQPHFSTSRQNPWLITAKAFIVVLEEHATLNPTISEFIDSQYFAKGDLATATAYICLEATTQNLGSCIIGLYDKTKIAQLLDITQDKHLAALIALGYPDNTNIRPKKRKTLDEVVRFV